MTNNNGDGNLRWTANCGTTLALIQAMENQAVWLGRAPLPCYGRGGSRCVVLMMSRTLGKTMANMEAQSQQEIEAAESTIAELEMSIKFMVTDYTIEFLAGKVVSQEYYVPGYQRELIWNDEEQSRFIESVLIGLPIPFIFLWQADDGRLEIVDGSQRLRTIVKFVTDELKLIKLQLLTGLNGFRHSNLIRSRQRKFNDRVLRGIVLDNSVTEAARTEMFNRINTGGTKANEAEVRRGALPGPFTDMIRECAEDPEFVALTPISKHLVLSREREELVVRFFTYLERIEINNGEVWLPDWKDRPREYIYSFVKEANEKGRQDDQYIQRLKHEFSKMLSFVQNAFPHGFCKSATGTQIPRVRFEAISVGAGLALRARDISAVDAARRMEWIETEEFEKRTTSGSANVRSKVQGRIAFVRDRLLAT